VSYPRLAEALLQGRPYFGQALLALQGDPDRHRYFLPVVRVLAASLARALEILEVGSWVGASAVSWAKALEEAGCGGSVTCIDTWATYFDMTKESRRHYVEMDEAARSGAALRLFLHNIRASGVDGAVRHQVGDSRKVLANLASDSFDLVYLDGSHAFEVVRSDIVHAKRLVRSGGVLCGDDLELQLAEIERTPHEASLASGLDYVQAANGRSYHPGVTEAVALELGKVSAWNGFWAVRKGARGWDPIDLDLQGARLPRHIEMELGAKQIEIVAETPAFNLLRCGPERYVALAKSLGPVEPLVERLGERDLGSVVFVGRTLDEVRAKISAVKSPIASLKRFLRSL